MDIYSETRALYMSAGRYVGDQSLLYYAQLRGLVPASTDFTSMENYIQQTLPTMEAVGKSFLERTKERFSEMYINFEARRRRKKELAKKGAISDANVVYPKLKPSEISEYRTTGTYLIRIITAAVSGFDPNKFKTPEGLRAYEASVIEAVSGSSGILDGIENPTPKETPKFSLKQAVLTIAGRDIGDSVNGWELSALKSTRGKLVEESERISFLSKRLVGLINSVSFDDFDEYPDLSKAIDIARYAMRIVLSGYKEWMLALDRVDLY